MNTLQKIDSWSFHHHPKWLDLIRVILGVTLLIKGYLFIHNQQALYNMAATSKFPMYTYATIYPRALTLLVGGLLIAVGMITRIACLFELPWAIGAVIFAQKGNGFFSDHVFPLWINILVLFFVIVFLIEGSGAWSVDRNLRKHKRQDSWTKTLNKEHLPHL